MNSELTVRPRPMRLITILLALAGCLASSACAGGGAVSRPPVTLPKEAAAAATQSVASIAASDVDKLASDFEHSTVGADAILIRDPARLAAPSRLVSGTVVASGGYALYGMPYYWVDTGQATPTLLVPNQHTRLSWPASWGRYKPDPLSDAPAVKLPDGMPDPIGLRLVAHARTAVLPGTTRSFALALDLKFLKH